MRIQLLLWVLIYLSCSGADIEPQPEAYLKEGLDDKFFTVQTKLVRKDSLLDWIIFMGQINKPEVAIKEIGFFYSNEKEILFNPSASFDDLKNSRTNITQVDFFDTGSGEFSTTGEFKIELQLPAVDTTYYFRSYGIFYEDSESRAFERTFLSEEPDSIPSVVLRKGWYKEERIGYLWERKGAFSALNATKTNCIIGGGCSDITQCQSSVIAYPFLEFNLQNDELVITEQIKCPKDLGRIYNRLESIGFYIGDTLYFGTGYIDNIVTKDFYKYAPADCDSNPNNTEANKINMRIDFTARKGGVGFAIGNYGYVGLGVSHPTSPRNNTLDDIWKFDPTKTDTTEQWIKLELDIQPGVTNLKRFDASTVVVNNKYAIIIGGSNNSSRDLSDILKFTPDPLNRNKAKVESLGTLPLPSQPNGRPSLLGKGVGFVLKNEIYVGLGRNKFFFKYDGSNWIRLDDFPGFPVTEAVGFSLADKGYMFTGFSNESPSNKPISRELWIYVPE